MLDERAALAEAAAGAEQNEAKELAQIGRCNLSPREKARLIERIGLPAYWACLVADLLEAKQIEPEGLLRQSRAASAAFCAASG